MRRSLQERLDEIPPIDEIVSDEFDMLEMKKQMEQVAQWKMKELFEDCSSIWEEVVDVVEKSQQGVCEEDSYGTLVYKIHKMLVSEDEEEKERGRDSLGLLRMGLVEVHTKISEREKQLAESALKP